MSVSLTEWLKEGRKKVTRSADTHTQKAERDTETEVDCHRRRQKRGSNRDSRRMQDKRIWEKTFFQVSEMEINWSNTIIRKRLGCEPVLQVWHIGNGVVPHFKTDGGGST